MARAISVAKVAALYGNPTPSPYGYNLSVFGTKGSVVRDKVSFDGLGHHWLDLPDIQDVTHDFKKEVEHLAGCILDGNPVLNTPREGAKSTLAALYAIKSAKSGMLLKVPEL